MPAGMGLCGFRIFGFSPFWVGFGAPGPAQIDPARRDVLTSQILVIFEPLGVHFEQFLHFIIGIIVPGPSFWLPLERLGALWVASGSPGPPPGPPLGNRQNWGVLYMKKVRILVRGALN